MTAAVPTTPAPVYTMDRRPLRDDVSREPSPPLTPEAVTALRRTVRHDKALSHQARSLFEDVCDLAAETGRCFASDKHFAGVYEVERRTVRRWIKELRDAGYIAVEGATKNRTLTPADPQLRTPHVLSPRAPRVLSEPDLGHSETPDLGHSASDAQRVINTPEGARTRAHEGALTREGAPSRNGGGTPGGGTPGNATQHPAVLAYAEIIRDIAGQSRQVPAMFAPKVAAAVGDDPVRIEAWAETVAVWASTYAPGAAGRGYNLGNIPGMLDAFRETVATRKPAASGLAPGFTATRHKPAAAPVATGADPQKEAAVARANALPRGVLYAEDAIAEAARLDADFEEMFVPAGEAPDGTSTYRRRQRSNR